MVRSVRLVSVVKAQLELLSIEFWRGLQQIAQLTCFARSPWHLTANVGEFPVALQNFPKLSVSGIFGALALGARRFYFFAQGGFPRCICICICYGVISRYFA